MNENDFGFIYDDMTDNFAKVESVIESVYTQLQNDPSNKALQDTLQRLGETAVGMLSSQILFTQKYATDEMKNALTGKLTYKKEWLSDTLGLDKESSRKM